MRIRFDEIQEITIPHLNNGKGPVSAKTLMDSSNRIMISRLPAGASIGLHFILTVAKSNYVKVKPCNQQNRKSRLRRRGRNLVFWRLSLLS